MNGSLSNLKTDDWHEVPFVLRCARGVMKMANLPLGALLAQKRKEHGFTQQELAGRLNVSFQAVSKWENNQTYPDVELLPALASILDTTVDALLGYTPQITEYERRYTGNAYYWGLKPNSLCYEILKLKPPIHPLRVLDIGCGEGKDAVFLARNGYEVTGIDAAQTGIDKARKLAAQYGVRADFCQADMVDYPLGMYDIVFSSGFLHYLPLRKRRPFLDALKAHTAPGGLHVMNVFVPKPFLEPPPDQEESEKNCEAWKSGELFTYYHDWSFERMEETIFDCDSGGIPHQHCMDIMIAQKPE